MHAHHFLGSVLQGHSPFVVIYGLLGSLKIVMSAARVKVGAVIADARPALLWKHGRSEGAA
eukprot:5166270-Amphidinium_carterae.2